MKFKRSMPGAKAIAIFLLFALAACSGYRPYEDIVPSGTELVRELPPENSPELDGPPADETEPPKSGPGPSTGVGFTEVAQPSDFDLSQVVWLHTNVSQWAVTSILTEARQMPGKICLEHTMAGRWPVYDGGEGNPWVFAKVGGRWYAATYEWLRPGQICKYIDALNIGAHTKKSPLREWIPQQGEVTGFMVSALARMGPYQAYERSTIKFVRWP